LLLTPLIAAGRLVSFTSDLTLILSSYDESYGELGLDS